MLPSAVLAFSAFITKICQN